MKKKLRVNLKALHPKKWRHAAEDKLHKAVTEAVPVREIPSAWSTIDDDMCLLLSFCWDLEQRTEEEEVEEVEEEPEPEPARPVHPSQQPSL